MIHQVVVMVQLCCAIHNIQSTFFLIHCNQPPRELLGRSTDREILPTTTEVTTTPKAKGGVMDNCMSECLHELCVSYIKCSSYWVYVPCTRVTWGLWPNCKFLILMLSMLSVLLMVVMIMLTI